MSRFNKTHPDAGIVSKARHTDDQTVGYYNTGDRMRYWGKVGALSGGLCGLLFGSALFMIPGLGSILVTPPLVGWILVGLTGAVVVGGLGALGAGLYSVVVPSVVVPKDSM